MALLAAVGPPGSRDGEREAIERGVRWLADTQRIDGSWDEPQFTGTGFPGDFYINYHLYRLVFPLTALGRYVADRLVESP
jgi:squalene-hopene/tetraprenyl-beta-curcumene cyclase